MPPWGEEIDLKQVSDEMETAINGSDLSETDKATAFYKADQVLRELADARESAGACDLALVLHHIEESGERLNAFVTKFRGESPAAPVIKGLVGASQGVQDDIAAILARDCSCRNLTDKRPVIELGGPKR